MLLSYQTYPSIKEVARPMLRLAGLRINPRTNGPHRTTRYTRYVLKRLSDGSERTIATPRNAHLSPPLWSPDGKRFAFLNTTQRGLELWTGESATGKTRRIRGVQINDAYGDAYQWMPDSRQLLCQLVPRDRGAPPVASLTPIGPRVQESRGRAAPARTYQDLLRTPHDADLFDYYATSQLALVDAKSGKVKPIGRPTIFQDVNPSPDGKHLLVTRNERPYSYLQGWWAFPREVEVWNNAGGLEKRVASLPLRESVPLGGVPEGPRNIHWRPDQSNSLVWVEALDGGDPKRKASHRDRLVQLGTVTDTASETTRLQHRYSGINWFAEGGRALVSEYDRDTRRRRTFLIDMDDAKAEPRLIWDRNVQDRYGDPGSPVMRTLPDGRRVLWQEGNSIFLTGRGASSQGDRPFLDKLNLETMKTERLFQTEEGTYEPVVALLSDDGSRFLTRRESATQPPNYVMRSLGGENKAITDYQDPAPQLRGITKRVVTYERDDGVPLSFTLYLPPGYQAGTPLPTILWAYPREYNDAATAGQVSATPSRFTTIGGSSHLFFLTQGYAVLHNAAVPIVGDPATVNDTFVEQLVAGAKAAIDKAVEMGVTDPDRVGVAGHSYGAFMTANLLAHSDLFRAGIARSGAYNRTLTPFGFQSERRTLWEAPEVYFRLSPFMHADKINEPLLMIHGEVDNNSGTFPMQSERMFHAIKGHGGTVRLVMLPKESHGYAARESIEHTLYEMLAWFDRHVKHAPPRRDHSPD